MYGTQTVLSVSVAPILFENDVKMYGTQTISEMKWMPLEFENDVKMYGTQTNRHKIIKNLCLRMM